MANYPRSEIVHDDAIFHVTWQAHNKDFLLASDDIKRIYYNLLLKYKALYNITIFSYCLMDNHIHLTGHCLLQKDLSDFFRTVNSLFARSLNKIMKRKGQAVMDRFKSPVMESDEDLMNVIIYNDLNPFRTIRQLHPRKFKWSSYHHYAYGKKDPLLTDPECYKEMGRTSLDRQKNYRYMLEEIMKDDHRMPKCPYKSEQGSYVCFVGSPHWVKARFNRLKGVYDSKRKEWYDRRRDFLEQAMGL